MGSPATLALGLLALAAAGALAQPAADVITVLPDFDDAEWRNLTMFAGERRRTRLPPARCRATGRLACAQLGSRSSVEIYWLAIGTPGTGQVAAAAPTATPAVAIGPLPALWRSAPPQATWAQAAMPTERFITTFMKLRCPTLPRRRSLCGCKGELPLPPAPAVGAPARPAGTRALGPGSPLP